MGGGGWVSQDLGWFLSLSLSVSLFLSLFHERIGKKGEERDFNER
jgi:hypothetical protein